jgi:acetyltransferase-like isoleucine patch superfamily enzyme
VKVYLGGNHRSDRVSTYPFHVGWAHNNTFSGFNLPHGEYPETNGVVIIENDVWIGDNVTIMSGVSIGNGAIIAAGSHVVKDVKPYSVVGGNPASHIKYRFSSDVIEKLLKIQWWNFSDDSVNDIVPLLCSPNIEEFIKKCYSIIQNEN